MTHVLIPSNFQEDSLDCLVELIETFPGLPLKVLLFHALEVPTCITDLLMLPRECREEELIPARFSRQCQELVQELEQVQEIKHAFFYGNTQSAFGNFLKANKIDFLVAPAGFRFTPLSSFSQNPMPYLKKAALHLVTVSPRVPQAAEVLAQ